ASSIHPTVNMPAIGASHNTANIMSVLGTLQTPMRTAQLAGCHADRPAAFGTHGTMANIASPLIALPIM
ncbi:MAG: hypothetical protein ACKPKO_33225, partial [Candidatus Fonsibacter sp.]